MDVIMGMQNMNGTCVVKCSMPLLYMSGPAERIFKWGANANAQV